jgi:biotin/methionine sulfoxide reductase
VLTADRGTSKLAQATTAHSCLIQIEKFDGALPPLTCYEPPPIIKASVKARTSFSG